MKDVPHSKDHVGDPALESQVLNAVTGRETDEEGLYRIGERVLNLQRARRNPAVQKGIIVSNTDGLQHAKSEVETLGEDFSSSLAYLEAVDVLKMAKSLREAWQIINGLELILNRLTIPDAK